MKLPIHPRRRCLPLLPRAFALIVPAVLLAACGGSHKPATPEPRVIVATAPAVASASPTPTPVPPTGGAPAAPSSTAAACAPGMPGCSSAPGTPAAPPPPPADNTLQAALARALVREGDLPSGYSAGYLGQIGATLPNQTAGFGAFFSNGDPTNPGPGGFQVFIAALAGFTDATSAQAQASDVRSSAISSLGPGVRLDPISTPAGVSGAQLYRVTAPNSINGQLSGFVIAWQHGRVLAVLAQLGVPPPISPDTINAVARRQDEKLRAAGL